MSKSTKIIEFAGLAGSGKTTIVHNLKEFLESKEKKVITLDDSNNIFKVKDIFKIIKCINIIEIYRFMKLFSSIKYNKNRKKSIYRMQIKLYIFYKYCKNYTNYDYALIDHGMIQNFVSLLFNSDVSFKYNIKFKKEIKKIIEFIRPNTIIKTELEIKSANLRMKTRGRKICTIEKEKDDIIRYKLFEKDKKNFEEIIDFCKKELNLNIYSVDTSFDLKKIMDDLIVLLKL